MAIDDPLPSIVRIGGIEMPIDMATRGVGYVFSPPAVVAINGLGDAVTAGGYSVDWSFAALSLDEWFWWTVTLLGSAASKRFASYLGSTIVVNDRGNYQAFSHCVVYRPQAESFTGVYYRGVKVRIDQMFAFETDSEASPR